MEWFITKDYTGQPFELFNLPHLAAIAIITLLNVSLIYVGQRFPQRWRAPVRYTLAAALIVDELLWHAWNWYTGYWSLQTTLPLHLCSVMVFVSAYMLVSKKYGVYEFVYFMGIAGATQAILTPDVGRYGFPHFRFFQNFVSHGSIVTAAVWMAAVEGYRPTLKSIVRVMVGSNIYMVLVGIINTLLGSNYMFLARKPDTASLLDVLPAWPWYIAYIELIGLVVIGLLYLPFAFRRSAPVREEAG